ncbi:peptidoglycan-binding protein [Calothrix sp. PCC 7507]|uniref:peptidoglycan-binding domain-containing protein n=1 Tax=Calothrix sp. PCC 7507 TaxID=99598 RepID=UPI00029F2A44|nr:peptidoglycan-binding domain-containing protein [Calothrix sp. PCC 7507]AFY35816.1 Peptidoglycan-binding domain 1 protein [Calothrix sp. PCC 7507]
MSELSLLMTGVLKTGQPSLPNLLEKQPFHTKNGVQNSIQSHLPRLVVTAQITPPEFIQTDRSSPDTSSALKLNTIRKQLPSSSYPVLLAQFSDSESVVAARRRAVRIRFQRVSSRPLPVVSFGSSGVAVRVLQRLLISNGYGMQVDGVFGPFTETAVKAFQNRRDLLPDGVVGQRTWRELTI